MQFLGQGAGSEWVEVPDDAGEDN